MPESVNLIDEDLLILRYFKPLKEDMNEKLKAGKDARLDKIYAICDPVVMEQYKNVDKATFEAWCGGYTAAVCEQIQMLCKKADKTAKQIGMVILTGGGCELYPVEASIRAILAEGALMVRPTDPTGVLDYPIQDKNHADYIEGLCPRSEVASLACVLGNLAEQATLVVPPPPPPEPEPKPYEPPTPPEPIIKRRKSHPKRYVTRKKRETRTHCYDCTFNIFDKLKKCANYCTCDEVCNCDKVCVEYSDCSGDCRPDCNRDCSCDSECIDTCYSDECGSDYFCMRDYAG